MPLSAFKVGQVRPHNYLTPFLNRHYVVPDLKYQSEQISKSIPELEIAYLDANFPFFNGFPLLPNRSHNDGKKLDLTFFYSKNGVKGNLKPSTSGYGVFIEPREVASDMTQKCKEQGHWQYDITKYLTFGSRSDLEFDEATTKKLLQVILQNSHIEKVFIEPHLVKRLNLQHDKLRFHGCKAVRHDDHIHIQIK